MTSASQISESAPALERRAKRRYPLRLPVTYVVLMGKKGHGRGTVVDVSADSVRFTTDCELIATDMIEVTIAWPALLNEVTPLKLILEAVVLRATANEAVARILRYQFRILGRLSPRGPVDRT